LTTPRVQSCILGRVCVPFFVIVITSTVSIDFEFSVGLRSCAQVSGAATGRPACERTSAPVRSRQHQTALLAAGLTSRG